MCGIPSRLNWIAVGAGVGAALGAATHAVAECLAWCVAAGALADMLSATRGRVCAPRRRDDGRPAP